MAQRTMDHQANLEAQLVAATEAAKAAEQRRLNTIKESEANTQVPSWALSALAAQADLVNITGCHPAAQREGHCSTPDHC
jgi:hypothetical protein